MRETSVVNRALVLLLSMDRKLLHFFLDVSGNLCMVTGGHNVGRVGVVAHRERHPGSFDIVHVKDSQGHTFATR